MAFKRIAGGLIGSVQRASKGCSTRVKLDNSTRQISLLSRSMIFTKSKRVACCAGIRSQASIFSSEWRAAVSSKLTDRRFYATESYDFPSGLKYTEEHEWLALEDGETGVIGITDYAAKSLGDVVYVELPAVGTQVVVGDAIGAIESVKSASDIYSPVSGTVVEVNSELETKPGIINAEAYSKGWIVKIKVAKSEELDSLMDNKEYASFVVTGEQ
ncbi:glycine cleavage system H protein [Dipodascopsis uninucleata]